MAYYRIELTPDDNGTFLATCPQLPEVTSWGETEAEAMEHAADAVTEALAARIHDGRELPAPNGMAMRGFIALDTLTATKVFLYSRMRQMGVTRAELMRRLGWNRESVDRLFKLDHASKMTQLDEAFRALGLGLEISVYPLESA